MKSPVRSERLPLILTLIAITIGFSYYSFSGHPAFGVLFALIMLAIHPISTYLKRRGEAKEAKFKALLGEVDAATLLKYQAIAGFLTLSSSVLFISLFVLRAFGFLASIERTLAPYLVGLSILFAVLWRGVAIWKWFVSRRNAPSR